MPASVHDDAHLTERVGDLRDRFGVGARYSRSPRRAFLAADVRLWWMKKRSSSKVTAAEVARSTTDCKTLRGRANMVPKVCGNFSGWF